MKGRSSGVEHTRFSHRSNYRRSRILACQAGGRHEKRLEAAPREGERPTSNLSRASESTASRAVRHSIEQEPSMRSSIDLAASTDNRKPRGREGWSGHMSTRHV